MNDERRGTFRTTITEHQFDVEMDRLENTFGTKFYNSSRKRMIWNHAQKLPQEGFVRVVDGMIATHRHAPLPKDFIEATYAELRRWRFTGNAFVIEAEPIRCIACYDLGIIRVIGYHDGDSTDELMRCSCVEGNEQTWNLPKWESNYGALFKRERCPLEWFVPQVKSKNDSEELALKIESIQDKWKNKIYKSQDFFKHSRGMVVRS